MNPTPEETAVKNRLLSTAGGGLTVADQASRDLIGEYNPQTIAEKYAANRKLTEESAALTAKRLESEYGTAVEDANISDTQNLQTQREKGGFAQMPVALNYMQMSHDKRIRDLTKQKNELLMSNESEKAKSLSELMLKEETATTNARTNFLSNYFNLNQEQRAQETSALNQKQFDLSKTQSEQAMDIKKAEEARALQSFDLQKEQSLYKTINTDNGTFISKDGGKTYTSLLGSAKPTTATPSTTISSLLDGSNQFKGLKLTTGQKNDISDMLVLQKQIQTLEKLKTVNGEYVGATGGGLGTVKQTLAKITGITTPQAQATRNAIGQIKGFIAKMRGGTSFTTNEQKLLDTYTPGINDSDAVIQSKLDSLKQYVNDKIESTAMVAGGTYTPENPIKSIEDYRGEFPQATEAELQALMAEEQQ